MLGARGVRPEIEFPLSPVEWGIFLFLSVHFPGIVCRFISFLSGRYYRPLSSFFSSCLGSGIGRLALRCLPSACGRLFATFRPLSLCHVSRGHKRQRPARNVLNAGVAPAACEGLLLAVLFLFCLLVGDVIPAFVLFPQFYSGFVHFAMEKCLDLALRTAGAAGSVAPTRHG